MTSASMNQAQYQVAAEAVAQTFSAAKQEMTQIEINLFLNEIHRLGPEAVMSFVKFWIGGGGQGSFRRAPTIEDLCAYTDPNYISSASALEVLRSLVASTGPWQDPAMQDSKMREAVTHLGGWAKVCSDMPDPADDFAYKRFAERFRAAWSRSEALAVQKRLQPPVLQGLIAAPDQLRLLGAPPDMGDAQQQLAHIPQD